jgi:hypothetical protein
VLVNFEDSIWMFHHLLDEAVAQNRSKRFSLHWWLFGVQMAHRTMGNIALCFILDSSGEI